ncbi:MAG: PKD domain-containing protein, partial [Conexibacter sp.]
SGVKTINVTWGDRTAPETIRRGAQHAYARPGRYVVRVVVTDRAGNRATVRQPLRIAKAGKRASHGKR